MLIKALQLKTTNCIKRFYQIQSTLRLLETGAVSIVRLAESRQPPFEDILKRIQSFVDKLQNMEAETYHIALVRDSF